MDIKLNFIQKGEGEPLILLHGNGEESGYFKNQIEEFSRHFKVIAVDTRGHGSSPRGEGPFSLSRFAEDLKSFMDEQNITKAHVLGFSDGGNIAMLFALKYPERVDKLILNGANLFPSGVKMSVQIPVVIGYWAAAFISLFDKKAVAKKELLGLMVNEPHIDPKQLSAINAPTLVIAGDNDMIKDSHTRLIVDSIKNSRLRIIKGDHFIAAKESESFNAELLDFLLNK
ncbi:MAG: alpha/beta hydrolase [Oscillospiraceae bacterium]|nr:alpha/beta hydrolase [Oscillospiraceae bacterium]